MTMSSALGSLQPHAGGRARQHRRARPRRGVATDEWLGIENTVMLVMGPDTGGTSSTPAGRRTTRRGYLFPRLRSGERPVRIGKPEGILIVAAGGPGMSETWVLFPHLASAITEPVVPEIPRLEVHRERHRPRSHQRPDAGVGAGPRTPDASIEGAVVGIVSNGLGRATRSWRSSPASSWPRAVHATSCSCGSRASRYPRSDGLGEVISQVTVAVAGFGG